MSRRAAIIAATVVTGVVVSWALASAVAAANRAAPPAADSVEVGFAQDMAVHHAQAVELAELIRGRTDDFELAALAADIALTQQAQLGRMQGWLGLWDRPQTTVGPRMAWMGHPTDGPMPGMATQADITALADATGIDAERRFLELMIEHHTAGVAMAEVAAAEAQVAEVQRLADAIVNGQRSELEVLRRLLAERDDAVAET